jgi:hypothetical protein
MKAKLQYTKTDGSRNEVTFESLAKLNVAFEASRKKHPNHSFAERIFVEEEAGSRTQFFVGVKIGQQWEPVGGYPLADNAADLEFELRDARRNHGGKCQILKAVSSITRWVEMQTAWPARNQQPTTTMKTITRPIPPFNPTTGEFDHAAHSSGPSKTSVFSGMVFLEYHNLILIRRGEDLIRDSKGVPLGFVTPKAAKSSAAWKPGDKAVRTYNLPRKLARL